MGGRAAEQVLLGSISSGSGGGAGSDLDQATDIVIAQEHQWGLGQGGGLFHAPVGLKQRHTLSESRRHVVNERLKRAEALAMRTLSGNKKLLICIAEALLEERELNDQEIRCLVTQYNQISSVQHSEPTHQINQSVP
jgi:cell division protease FtsH